MAEYSKEEIKKIEEKWRKRWVEQKVFKTEMDPAKPKYYVLDMFPYPSGVGLHVGHPLGYIASDIVARYKRVKGFNVLHPMGFDAFGLPAEQYAIQTGQHPATTTEKNIETYKRQLNQIGLSFDWDREVRTSDPEYYKWTQWIFMQLFNAWYNKKSSPAGKTEHITSLIEEFEKNGNSNVDAECDAETPSFSATEWKSHTEKQREELLQKYRIAYQSEAMVNWCPALGTVLSNDEVKDGVSERGGYPVERIKMLQWSMRISAYAERLLTGLNTIDWPDPLKEMQRNWIGKSTGCELRFELVQSDLESSLTPALSGGEGDNSPLPRRGARGEASHSPEPNSTLGITVFTTRIDTIYGVTFMVIAPEHELAEKITTDTQRDEVNKYVEVAKNRSERERMSEVKRISGVFTGAYVINPFNHAKVPVWIADYVLAGYGTGAVMAVPSSDTRDYAFAKHFNLPIIQVLDGETCDITKENFDAKSGSMINSDFLNGLPWEDAIEKALQKVDTLGIGSRKVNYRMRDAIFGRQRYWGEPFPVYYKNGIPKLVAEQDLPITLPEIDEYKPTETGEPPLARAKDWKYVSSLTPGPSPGERGSERERETAEKKYWPHLKEFAKANRSNQTNAESIIWEEVRNNKLGHKIRRQHAIGIFIADFVCLDKRLVIEIDGEYHLSNKENDQERTAFLKVEGFNLIRFTNKEVQNQLPSVLSKIKTTLDNSPSISVHSSLSPGEGRGEAFPFELTTMPGWAGSSWYWFRYMDPKNEDEFVGSKELQYWKDVDLYIGGSEHATGHLLYSRFWCKALKDLGFVDSEEPFRKLINQGHIQGVSQFIKEIRIAPSIKSTYDNQKVALCVFAMDKLLKEINVSIEDWHHQFLSQGVDGLTFKYKNIKTGEFIATEYQESHAKVEFIENNILNIEAWLEVEQYKPILFVKDGYWHWDEKKWKKFDGADFIENSKFETRPEVEKMSKSKLNVINPDSIIDSHGADTLRMYEMFLGPLEQSKPWNTAGIDGVFKFLRRFWNLSHDAGHFKVSDSEPTREELKVLHKTLKKVEQDIENFSFNTSVSEFMICVNELTSLKCNKRGIIEPLVIALSPFAPHIAEELWEKLGHKETVLNAQFPKYDESYLKENAFNYPISINGKVRAQMNFALDMPKEDIEKMVLASEIVMKWTEGKPPKKVIVVPGKIVNVVL